MADPMFIIAIVFLVLGASLGGYVVYHKQIVMVPLEMQEKAEIESMSCDEVKVKHELGQYWSFTNWKIANQKVKSCTPPE
jgi:hypothetical protein